ncbi:hypothetical protein SESBI_22579 [Sesbania bispinosa]|nr:hypothetical protein SESBI_22579 [Sesbania bispinosa]
MASAEDTPMLPDPPDGKEGSQNQQVSFKDKFLAGKGRVKDSSKVDLIHNNLFRIESCPKPKVLGCNSQTAPTQGTSQVDIGNQSLVPPPVMEPQDQLHGEWLVVSRSRKSGAQKGKGKAKLSSFESKNQQERDKNVTKVNQEITTSDFQEAPTGEVIFSAQPTVPSRSNKIGKKRSRIEIKSTPERKGPSPTSQELKHKSTAPQVEASSMSARKDSVKDKPSSSVVNMNGSSKPSPLHDFGIKTTMNVDIIEPHRLRFKDDETMQKSLDDKLGVFLQPQHRPEEYQDSDTASEMDGEDDNPPAGYDADMIEENSDQIQPGVVQHPSG